MTFARQSLGSLAALVFGVAASVVLARVLGPEARGAYDLAVRPAGLILAVAQWGVPEVLLQLVALRRDQLGTLVGTSLLLGLAGALAASGLTLLALPLLADNLLRGVEPLLVWLALAGSVLSVVGLLARRFIQLAGQLHLYNALDIGRTALFLGLAAAAAVLLPRQALGATAAWLLAELALAVAAAGYLWSRRQAAWRFSGPLAIELLGAGAPVQLGLVAMFVGSEGGRYVVNAQLDLVAVGVYVVALSVARLILQVSAALRAVLQARLVGPEADSAVVTARVTRHGLLWMLLLAAALVVGAPLAPLVFGREYGGSGPVLVLFLPGMIAYGVWQLLAGHLLRVGRRRLLAAVAWAFALAAVALQALGAQALGLVGAAAGLSAAYLLACAIVLAAFVRLTGHPPRALLPGPAELAFYARLARGLLAAPAAPPELAHPGSE